MSQAVQGPYMQGWEAARARYEAEAKRLRHLLRVLHDDPQPLHEDCDICDALREMFGTKP